jgi:hypothetical protein
MPAIVVIPVAEKESAVNALAIIGVETNYPHVIFRTPMNVPMTEVSITLFRYARGKNGKNHTNIFIRKLLKSHLHFIVINP